MRLQRWLQLCAVFIASCWLAGATAAGYVAAVAGKQCVEAAAVASALLDGVYP